MQSILKLFDPKEIDSVTIAEVKHYAQLKYDEQAKINAPNENGEYDMKVNMLW